MKLNVSSLRSTSESKLLSSDDDDEEDDVSVCGDESLFIQVTVSPTLISRGFGLYELLPEFPTMLNTFPSSVIVVDEGDDDVFMRLLKETKEEIPEMELKVLDESDHWVIIEKPKEMYDILMNFLKIAALLLIQWRQSSNEENRYRRFRGIYTWGNDRT